MTLASAVALFGAMVVLAALPSMSVLTVVTRAIASGFAHGVATALGIVCGDIIFILVAIYGLSLIAGTVESLFVLLKWLGGVYLIWLGISLWRAGPVDKLERSPFASAQRSIFASFYSGLLLTLADQKAILFYGGFFPAFVDVSSLSAKDTGVVIGIAIIAVGGVKLAYAKAASSGLNSLRQYFSNRFQTPYFRKINLSRLLNKVAGSILFFTGAYLLFRT